MKTTYKILCIGAAITLAGCTSTAETAQQLIQQLDFKEGETGCIRIDSNIDLNPMPFLTSNASLVYKKETGEDGPEC